MLCDAGVRVIQRTNVTCCVMQVSTTSDSLSVALGSTFGAFLALAVIVMFVLVAKWQHRRMTHKPEVLAVVADDDVSSQKGIEMSDVSLHVNDNTAEPGSSRLSATSSDQSVNSSDGGGWVYDGWTEGADMGPPPAPPPGPLPGPPPSPPPGPPFDPAGPDRAAPYTDRANMSAADLRAAYTPAAQSLQLDSPSDSLVSPPSLRVNWSCNW